MKQYLLSIIQPDGDMPAPEVMEPIMRDTRAFYEEVVSAGVWVFTGGLHEASTSTVVKVKDGEVLMTDGPYAEGKEHLGGICIVRVPDLDAALEWGRKLARATTLPVEVRPFRSDPED